MPLPTEIDQVPSPEDWDTFVYLDEVGRGCLAGPVCAAAVIWPRQLLLQLEADMKLLQSIRDSKKLSEQKRKTLEKFIKEHAVEYTIGVVDNNEIDEINILQATYKAMHIALNKLKTPFTRIVVDGNRFKRYRDIPYSCVVGGDDKLLQIAAASILAKTYRDDMILELSKANENLACYKFEKNKGYGTKEHLDAIIKYGPSSWHRRSFITKYLRSA